MKAAVKMRCCVQNCTNDMKKKTQVNRITFHKFPKEEGLRNTWIEALGIYNWKPKEHSVICSEHFEQDAFYETKCGLRRIRDGAVPTLAIESTEELEAPAELRVCRMCLAIDVKMHHITDFKLRHLYEEVTGIILTPEDRLPKMVCWECVGRLTSAKRFKDKALRCCSLLANNLNTENYMTIRDVKAINRSRHKLQSNLTIKCIGNDDCDRIIRDDEIVKAEKEVEHDDNFSDDNNDNNDDMQPVVMLEVMKEKIFVEEYPGFVSGDSKSLSKVYKEKKVMQRKCNGESDKVKEVPVKEEVKVSLTDNDAASTIMDKYRNSSVRRRKVIDGLDESLFTITALTYDEQIAEVQARQASAAYRAAPHKCAVCFRGFQLRDSYNAHVVRHSEQSGAYECFICKTRQKTARALRNHLTTQHTEKYSCKGCPFATRNRGVAREHEKWHAGTKYQCPHCPSEFDKATTYFGHIRIKHVSSYVCELCGYTFISQKGIDMHKNKKHRLADKNPPLEGPYCAECDVRFVSEEAHARHLKLSSRHSSDDDPNRIRNVSQNLNTERNGRVMRRRIKRRSGVHSRAINCEQCGIQLQSMFLYAHHFLRAHPEKSRTNYPAMKSPSMCEQCGKIFQKEAHLKMHMLVHTGEKPFKCDHCGKSFMRKSYLVIHMRVHSASCPTYECSVCGKHFSTSNNRSRHMFIHTGLKSFKCETCGKCFTTADEQRAHVKHVHLKKPWPKRAQARASECVRGERLNVKQEENERE